MNEKELYKLTEEIENFLEKHINELNFSFEYEGDYDGDMKRDEANYIIIVKNTPSALQRLVLLRNTFLNSEKFSIYEFIEEQVGDQMADGDEDLVVDFYIGYKN